MSVISFLHLHPINEYDLEKLKKYAKNRWYQKKHRDNLRGKKQQNFILSEKAISRLNTLSKKHGIKRSEVLELLLKLETDQNIYLKQALSYKIDNQ